MPPKPIELNDPHVVACLTEGGEILGYIPDYGKPADLAKQKDARRVEKAQADALAKMWNDHAKKIKSGRKYEARAAL